MRELPQSVAVAIESASVPALPQVLVRLIQQVDDEGSTMDQLAAVIAQDPGLCARILAAANSAAFQRSTAPHDIKSCVQVLGTRLVRAMATCLAVKRLFEKEPGSLNAELTGFWQHSLLVAETAQALASATGYARPDEAYLAGLLHDVGQLLLLSSHGEQYAWLLSQSSDEPTLLSLEQARLGVQHIEAGAWLADQWQLESGLADAILFHHVAAEQIVTATQLPRLLWLADAVCRNPPDAASLSARCEALFGPSFGPDSPLDLEGIASQALDQVEVIARALGIEPPAAALNTAPRTIPQVSIVPPAAVPSTADRALEERIRDIAVLHPLQQDLAELDSDAELLNSLRESARILFDLTHLGFLLIDPESGTLSGAVSAPQPTIFRETSLAVGTDAGLATRAIAKREVRCSFDEPLSSQASLLDHQLARAFGSEGILAVPMMGRRRMVGVMLFGLGREQHGRLKRRYPWLLNFGRIAGISLEAWQNTGAARRQAEDTASVAFQRQARRIVHEAGNPLGIIKSYLKILDMKLPAESGVRQELDILREEIDRVGSIMRRLSEVPAQAEVPSGGVRPVEVIRELLALYREPLFESRGISVLTDLGHATGETVACDADSLKQILLNLWKNAAEAMSAGDRFDIAIAEGVMQGGRRHVEIRLQDTGPGMPEAAIRNLSFPEQVAGDGDRGLGLSIVGRIAARVGCTITCRSGSGHGTTLSLLLPCEART
ncbi:HDOD domain-containing protein [Azoarcus sp. KH32C]|uniref:HDOD domain-containing protein n=1 Tax=Azoarcus sp. KH32C TaxID=748247 RepID=UPI0002386036|nr:HDOD domain-containing protein [Azoarcus sp. KH32C]BAL25088.1 putative histidine kinase [Azoarcus sp. KH32C]